MEGQHDAVRCLALPLVGEQLLVPNAVVEEVFAAGDIRPAVDGPDWLIGSLVWRGGVLPLVCMEAAIGGERPASGARSKVVVMKALTASEGLSNYAVLVQGIPHQVLATGDTVTRDPQANGARPFVAADLLTEGGQALVPDLDAVERALIGAADSWRSAGSDESGADGAC